MSEAKYTALREACLRVVEGRSDGIDKTFMGDVLLALQEREILLEALIACADRLAVHMKHTEDLIAHIQAHKAIATATGEPQ